MYSSTLSLTSALDGVGGQRHAPAALPPGKTRYPLYRRLGGPQGRSGQVRKISPPPGFDHRTFQPVASSNTDYAILAQREMNSRQKWIKERWIEISLDREWRWEAKVWRFHKPQNWALKVQNSRRGPWDLILMPLLHRTVPSSSLAYDLQCMSSILTLQFCLLPV